MWQDLLKTFLNRVRIPIYVVKLENIDKETKFIKTPHAHGQCNIEPLIYVYFLSWINKYNFSEADNSL